MEQYKNGNVEFGGLLSRGNIDESKYFSNCIDFFENILPEIKGNLENCISEDKELIYDKLFNNDKKEILDDIKTRILAFKEYFEKNRKSNMKTEYLIIYSRILIHQVSNGIIQHFNTLLPEIKYQLENCPELEMDNDEIMPYINKINSEVDRLILFLEYIKKGGFITFEEFGKNVLTSLRGEKFILNIENLNNSDFEIEVIPFMALFGEIVQNYDKYGKEGKLTIDFDHDGPYWTVKFQNKIKPDNEKRKKSGELLSTNQGLGLIEYIVKKDIGGEIEKMGEEDGIYVFQAKFKKNKNYLDKQIVERVKDKIGKIINIKEEAKFGKNVLLHYDILTGTLVHKDELNKDDSKNNDKVPYITDENIKKLEIEYKKFIKDILSMSLSDFKKEYFDTIEEQDSILYK